MKDYTNLYATAAQIIPVFVLIFTIEARGLSPKYRQASVVGVTFIIGLLVAAVGEICALVALGSGTPAGSALVLPAFAGALSALGLGIAGVFLLATTTDRTSDSASL
jgi:hypothetical protein